MLCDIIFMTFKSDFPSFNFLNVAKLTVLVSNDMRWPKKLFTRGVHRLLEAAMLRSHDQQNNNLVTPLLCFENLLERYVVKEDA